MKALGLWLLVVRLAVVAALALQCTSPREGARPKTENNGTSIDWRDSAWRPSEGLVAMASEPKAPALRGRRIVEITRCATDGSKNACSKLYGALCRAAGNIGYTQARTYTRLDEPGTSLRAAGFVDDGLTREESWDRPSRKRGGELSQVRRWVRHLGGAA